VHALESVSSAEIDSLFSQRARGHVRIPYYWRQITFPHWKPTGNILLKREPLSLMQWELRFIGTLMFSDDLSVVVISYPLCRGNEVAECCQID
jgi:hypothetical protein